jgi:phosphoserine aminotransferase
MLCVEDYLDTLAWAKSIGGATALQARADANLAVFEGFVAKTDWIDFLAVDKANRSNTSVCLKVVAPWFTALSDDDQAATAKKLSKLLEDEGVALDINGYRDAPAGLRIWCGSTVETSDLEKLLPWLEWGFAEIQNA